MKKSIFFAICIALSSCYVLPKKNKLYQSFTSIDIGVIGKQEKTLRESDFKIVGIPNYENKIRLSAVIVDFDKSNFKSYKKYLSSTSKTTLVNEFIDSISQKPKYVELEILDKVQVVNTLNKNNKDILKYLRRTPENTIITKLKFVADKTLLKNIKNANVFYLQTAADKKQQFLKLFKDTELIASLNMSLLQSFQYDVSSFCWEISEKKSTTLVTILDEGELCKNGTVRNPNKAIDKKIKKFDF